MFETRHRQHVANCPACSEPHHYTEFKFPMVNDSGSWLIECSRCSQQFVVNLCNPADSDAKHCKVLERFDDKIAPYAGGAPKAAAAAIHNLNMNQQALRFDYGTEPIYRCARGDDDLEASALAALRMHYPAIRGQLDHAINIFLAQRMPNVVHAVVHVTLDCPCGEQHRAIFYYPFRLDGSSSPSPEEMLLAHVSGADLADWLTGIFSKTYVMESLEKLIARWRLLSDQIIIAAPFVGHQYKTKAQKLEIWERLLGLLDADRTVLLTRPAGYSEYKKALLDSGLDHDILVRFGLQNRIVSAGTKKQDFHAKVYIGVGERSEVLSGSANIVSGKSLENASFAACTRTRVDSRYLGPLGVTLSTPPARASYHVTIAQVGGDWRFNVKAGPAPTALE